MDDSKLSEKLYQKFKYDILTFKLKPGEEVSTRKISDLYGGSRTPAREAIVRLKQEDLLIVRPKSGTVISPISVERVRQERFVRAALECAAVDDFIMYCSPFIIRMMDEVNALMDRSYNRKDYFKALKADMRFHKIILETSRNPLAYEVSTEHCSHDLRMRYLSISMGNQNETVEEDHGKMIEAASRGDISGLKQLTEKHLGRWKEVIAQLQSICPESYFTE